MIMAEDDIQIISVSKSDSISLNILEKSDMSMDTSDIEIIGDNHYTLDDEGIDTSSHEPGELISDYNVETPVSLRLSDKNSSSRRAPKCFNCLGEHTVSNCPLPLNQRTINSNKRAHNDSSSRMHKQPLTKFKPGTLSSEAYYALRLSDDEYPPWIYKMREAGPLDGYPPAYLKKIVQSEPTLEFFTADPSFSLSNDRDNVKIDEDNIIFYDGFNDISKDSFRERATNDGYRVYSSKEDYKKLIISFAIAEHKKEQRELERKKSARKRHHDDDDNDYYKNKKARKNYNETPVSRNVAPPINGNEKSNEIITLDDTMDDSPASPTLPPVVSKCLTEDMREPEKLTFPLVSHAKLPSLDKWAKDIQEFKHENVVEESKGIHKKIHQFLKSIHNDD